MINKAITVVIGLILGVVGLLIFIQATPPLVGKMIVAIGDTYLKNATGCYIVDGTTYTPVDSFYCTGLDLTPLIIIGLFFAGIVTFIVGVMTKHIRIKGFNV